MKKKKEKRIPLLLDFLFGVLDSVAMLTLGTLLSAELISAEGEIPIFDRGDGIFSDLLFFLNLLFLGGLVVFSCLYSLHNYGFGHNSRFFGMEVALLVCAGSYFLYWMFYNTINYSGETATFVYNLVAKLQIPFSSVAAGAAEAIVEFTGKTAKEINGLMKVCEVIMMLAPTAPVALIVVRAIDFRLERSRKHKRFDITR